MKIFLADDSADVRLALQVLVDNEPGMDVVGMAVHIDGLHEQVLASRADVLLLDCDLPGEPQVSTLADLKAASPNLKVILLTISSALADSALAAQADAQCVKAFGTDALVEVLRAWRDERRRSRSSRDTKVHRRERT